MKKDKRKAQDKDGIKEEEKRRKMRRIKQVNREGLGKRKNHRGMQKSSGKIINYLEEDGRENKKAQSNEREKNKRKERKERIEKDEVRWERGWKDVRE